MIGDFFMEKEKVLVSACLLGKNCKYDGKNNKEKSPSCGFKKRYDGTFSKTIIEGSGIFAQLLKDYHIKILTEEDF